MPSNKQSKCKVAGCKGKVRNEGFCFTCYVKYTKGYYDDNGEKSLSAAEKEREAKKKDKKRAERKRAKKWETDKKQISASLRSNPKLLQVLQEEDSGLKQAQWCKALEFWVCPASCYSRMFMRDHTVDACGKCHVHDDKFDSLKSFLEDNT